MIEIKPTTFPDEKKGESYTLEDKDFLLINSINNLANEIQKLRISNG